jgi:hypothetical protein
MCTAQETGSSPDADAGPGTSASGTDKFAGADAGCAVVLVVPGADA